MIKTSVEELARIAQWQRDNPGKVKATVTKWRTRQNGKGLCRACCRPLASNTLCSVHVQQAKDERLMKAHGLSREQHNELVNRQQGLCAICSRHLKLFVDHDHTTGERRGLLCNNCNSGIGRFKDNPAWLEAAANYLRDYYPDSPTGRTSQVQV